MTAALPAVRPPKSSISGRVAARAAAKGPYPPCRAPTSLPVRAAGSLQVVSWAGNTPTTQVQGCRRRLAPTAPLQLMRLRCSSAGPCRLPAAEMTTGACLQEGNKGVQRVFGAGQ